MTESIPNNFEDFWLFYLSQHRDPVNRAIHVAGTLTALGLAAVSPAFPPAFLAAPVVGYGFAWVGHFVFEKNRPASWISAKAFAWSFRGDLRMAGLTLTGRLPPELERMAARYPAGAITA